MHRAYLSLGSNIDAEANLPAAVGRLGRYGRVAAASAVYETLPVGFKDQANFLNAAVLLETDRSLEAVLDEVVPAVRLRHADDRHELPLPADPVTRGAAEAAPRVVVQGQLRHRAGSGDGASRVGRMGGTVLSRSRARRRKRLKRNKLKKCITPSTKSTVPTLSLRSSTAERAVSRL